MDALVWYTQSVQIQSVVCIGYEDFTFVKKRAFTLGLYSLSWDTSVRRRSCICALINMIHWRTVCGAPYLITTNPIYLLTPLLEIPRWQCFLMGHTLEVGASWTAAEKTVLKAAKTDDNLIKKHTYCNVKHRNVCKTCCFSEGIVLHTHTQIHLYLIASRGFLITFSTHTADKTSIK